MRQYISVFIIMLGVFGFSSCNKDIEKVGASLIDETNLVELPKDELRFSWRGDRNVEQKLVMWLDGLDYNTPDLKAPKIYQLGISSQIKPTVSDVYSISIGIWEPLEGESYNWLILSYYDDGTIVESDERQFIPNPL